MKKDSEVIEREVKIMKMLHDFVELNKLNMGEALSAMLSFAMTLFATQNVPPEKVKGILDETYSTYKKVYKIKNPL